MIRISKSPKEQNSRPEQYGIKSQRLFTPKNPLDLNPREQTLGEEKSIQLLFLPPKKTREECGQSSQIEQVPAKSRD